MNRIIALLAIIAFAVMGTVSARAERPAMTGTASMPTMAVADHPSPASHDPQPPCDQAQNMACAGCCAVVPAVAPIVPVRLLSMTGFKSAHAWAQAGLAVPPALPPPRA